MSPGYTQLESRILSLLKSWAPAEPDFNALALEVYRFQRMHNEPYDNYCKHLGAPANLNEWRQIPAVPQSAFKQFALRAFPENQTVKTFHTSGTTGEGFGSHHFYTSDPFGYFSAGLQMSVPLSFIPECYGKWAFSGGYTYYYLGQTVANATATGHESQHVLQGAIGLTF